MRRTTKRGLITRLSLSKVREEALEERIEYLNDAIKEALYKNFKLKESLERSKKIVKILETKAQMTERGILSIVTNPTIKTMPSPALDIVEMRFVRYASINFTIRKAFNQIEYLGVSYDNLHNESVGFNAYQDIENISDPKDGYKYFEMMMEIIKKRMYNEIKSRLANPNT